MLFLCYTDDLSLSGQIAEEEPAFESEDGLVSTHCSAPMLQSVNNNSVVTLTETEMDGGKDDSKFSMSTSYCDNKSAYSSMVGSDFFMLAALHLHFLFIRGSLPMICIYINIDFVFHYSALQAGSHSSFMIGIRQNSREDFGTKYFKELFLQFSI